MPNDIDQIAAETPEDPNTPEQIRPPEQTGPPLRTVQIPIYFRFAVREEDQIKAQSALETALGALSKQIGQLIRQEAERYGNIEYGGWQKKLATLLSRCDLVVQVDFSRFSHVQSVSARAANRTMVTTHSPH